MAEQLNLDAIHRDIDAGYINVQEHPHAPYRILNYNQRAQFDWHWTEATMVCRGLIVDEDWNVVARPFPKFFSVDQLNGVVPNEPFEAYDKVDGSLGILYHHDGKPCIASRGSFVSDQAKRGTEMLVHKYGHIETDPNLTYLFEIIYPENRIVVDYGDTEDLILLAVIETRTGVEFPLEDIGFPLVKRYDDVDSFEELMSQQDNEREGFVARFQSGQRVKIKFEEYKRLHKLLTGVSPKAIWDVLRSGGDLDEVVDRVPDEFYQWVRETENAMRMDYCRIEAEARSGMIFSGERRVIAEHFKSCNHPGVMFAMLDGKNYSDTIWKMVKPSGRAFRCDELSI